jgi:hypothetical protein
MNGGSQVVDRTEVGPTREARLPQTLQEEIRRRPVMFIAELADKLGCSTRTILRQLRAGTFFIPESPKVDHRHRWSRERVYLAIADTTLESHRRSLLGPRAVRKGHPS